MSEPDYDFQARQAARVVGWRLVRARLDDDRTLYGQVEYAQWHALSLQESERRCWYEVRFTPLGKRSKLGWASESPGVDGQLNRLHFSVLKRTAGHPGGSGSVARLGPIGHVRTEPKSIGLGTYLRDQLIDWVAGLHPDASVAQGALSSVDAGADNCERRNRFYQGAHFQVRVQDDGSGAFWADRLDGLRRHTDGGKVTELARAEVQELLQAASVREKLTQQVADLQRRCGGLQKAADKAQLRFCWATAGLLLLTGLVAFATMQGMLSWHLF